MNSLYTAEYIMWKLQNTSRKIEMYDGISVKVSKTLKLIKNTGCQCIKCGKIGTHFEYTDNGGLNLFYEDKGGKVIFTKDHIIPKSRGGIDTPINYQLMCQKCNSKKADKFDFKNTGNIGLHISNLFDKWAKSLPKSDHKIKSNLHTKKLEIIKKYGNTVKEQKITDICREFKLPCPSKALKNQIGCRVLIKQV